ncbi:unnamed protein product [Gongylonema pulchrum]|uniref:Uncharacterized protein n=1 Tax=Gongylonema pulchrum TaxID=637853 RepID=A0A3P7LTL0_9BILA|nr:unnamed protein product [Gongylonema pulchrum]
MEEKGLQRVRLLPKGFDATITQSVVGLSKVMEIEKLNLCNAASDRSVLARAFYLFSKAELAEADAAVRELLENRHTGIAKLCTEYAIDLVDDIPNDERWKSMGLSSTCMFCFYAFFLHLCNAENAY